MSPPLVRLVAAIPVTMTNAKTEWWSYDTSPSPAAAHAVGRDFAMVNGERTFWLFTIARWACIPFSLIEGMSAGRGDETSMGCLRGCSL
ncbi:MAG: hypothetical protein R3B91_12060 [Planctomycetaceae bacterium]